MLYDLVQLTVLHTGIVRQSMKVIMKILRFDNMESILVEYVNNHEGMINDGIDHV